MKEYRTGRAQLSPLGNGEYLLHSRETGQRKLVGRETARLYHVCMRFAPLDDHVDRFRRGAQGTPPDAHTVREKLHALIDDGFLVSRQEIVDEVREKTAYTAHDEPLPIRVLGIPHRGSPDMLARALRSFAQNVRDHGRRVRLVVVDDTEAPMDRAANRAVLKEVATEFGLPAVYIDRDERRRYARAIARRGKLRPDPVEFALLGHERSSFRPGAARNALLLHAVGEAALQVDADTTCRLARPPVFQSEVSVLRNEAGGEYWFCADHDEAERRIEPVKAGVLDLHESVLGRSTAHIIGGALRDGRFDRRISDLSSLHSLTSLYSAVPVSVLGSYGDSGMHAYSNVSRLALRGATHRRLVEDPEAYRDRLNTRTVIRAPRRLALNPGSFCMSMNIALDGTSLLPPFLPVERNEDGIFGAVLRAVFPSSYVGYHPYLIEHQPSGPRRHAHRLTGDGVPHPPARLASLIEWIIQANGENARRADVGDSLRSLGRMIEGLGSSETHTFTSITQNMGISQHVRHLRSNGAFVESQAGPRYWRHDMEQALAAQRAALLRDESFIPYDVQGEHRTPAGSRPLYQEYVRRYGQLLSFWPDIYASAVEMKWDGDCLGTEVAAATATNFHSAS